MKRGLVISAHPDDEAIGCGGTLRHHVVHGDMVPVVFLTSGEAGGHGRSPAETLQLREREARAVAAVLGIARVEFWREPDGAFRVTRLNVERLCKKIRDWRPHIIFSPWVCRPKSPQSPRRKERSSWLPFSEAEVATAKRFSSLWVCRPKSVRCALFQNGSYLVKPTARYYQSEMPKAIEAVGVSQ